MTSWLGSGFVGWSVPMNTPKYENLSTSPNYVTRHSIKLLSDFLLESSNAQIMKRYFLEIRYLKVMMTLLTDSSKYIQLSAFHIFKPRDVRIIFGKNQEKLLGLLHNLSPGKEDEQFVSRGVEGCKQLVDGNVRQLEAVTAPGSADGDINLDVVDKGGVGRSCSKKEKKQMDDKDVCTEREDPSEFITHRAKDFLSSIKDIEHRFIRASESGRDVSRLLEAPKIKVGFSEAKWKSSTIAFISSILPVCYRRKILMIVEVTLLKNSAGLLESIHPPLIDCMRGSENSMMK